VFLDGAGRNPELAGDSGVAMAFGQQRAHCARSLAVSSASGSLRLRRANNSWTRATTDVENVRPWVTRGKVEGMMLRDVADLIEGVESRVLKAPKTNWNPTEIVVGPVLLTAGAVQTPGGPVDKADFRIGLARTNQQLLFDVDGVGQRPIYAMVLHSGYKSLDPDEREQYGPVDGVLRDSREPVTVQPGRHLAAPVEPLGQWAAPALPVPVRSERSLSTRWASLTTRAAGGLVRQDR
jgi:hypothetical protein